MMADDSLLVADSSESVAPSAVEVQNASKSYGRGSRRTVVLENLDMSVPRGAIYGLLGPSGCGKTTLLKCIVGRLQMDSGLVTTLGKPPGTIAHEVPGKKVGYMPQELALWNEFTISETMFFFGRLFGMKSTHIHQRIDFLVEFLHLPPKDRVINQTSGGQQRRTSFAVALLQEPQLLILDEPTVGVDPLLRQRIWDHLLEISSTGQVTTVITTHYVEEARQAQMVGLMRGGRLLAEAPPDQLLRVHELQSLEDVFLLLCQQDQVGDIEVNDGKGDHKTTKWTRKPVVSQDSDDVELLGSEDVQRVEDVSCRASCYNFLPSLTHIMALIIKNFIVMKRQIGFLLFEFFLPSFQIILFCLCIGRSPYGLNVAVFNSENCTLVTADWCGSQQYLSHLSNHTLHQTMASSMEDALDQVRHGDAWAAIYLGANYTQDLIKRYKNPMGADNITLDGSSVHVWLDGTNQQIAWTIQGEVLTAFNEFAKEFIEIVFKDEVNPDVIDIPVKMEPPIYGSLNPTFTDFMAPGVILSITFFLATGLTALSFVLERKQGVLERSFIAGVTALEVMISHICTQFLVMMIQVTGILVFVFAVFKVTLVGSLLLVILLTLFQGFTGMALGMLISAVCDEETSAIQAAIGSMYPSMLLSGIIWPVQGMPVWLRHLSYGLPMTLAAESMRAVISRGWDLTYKAVWEGYVVSLAWGWGLLAITIIILRFKGI